MRQVREARSAAPAIMAGRAETLDVGVAGRGSIVLPGLMFIAAVGAGYLATYIVRPPDYLLMVVMAIGGAAAIFLIVAVPTQAIHLARRLTIRVGLALKRAQLRSLLDAARGATADKAGGEGGAAALADLALVKHLTGASEAARQDLDRALEIEPQNSAALNNLAVLLATTHQYEQATDLLAQAAAAGATKEARANLGLLAPFADSTEPFKDVVVGTPNAEDVPAMNNVGVLYMKNGEDNIAREWFGRALREEPANPYALANLGLLHYHRGRTREAIAHLISAARSAPEDARIINNLGVALAAAGRPAWSFEQLQRAHDLEPVNVGIRVNMASAQALEGHFDTAIRALRGLTSAGFHRADVHYNISVLQLAEGNVEAAAEAAAAAIEEGETSADAHTNRAAALWESGHRTEALAAFEAAHLAQDAGPRAASNLGRALMLEGDLATAVRVLDGARAKWRGDGDVALDLATALLAVAAGRYHQDMASGERSEFFSDLHVSYAGLEGAARQGEQAPPEAHINMGLYYCLREDHLSGAAEFEIALKALPNKPELHHLAGTAYGRAADGLRTRLEDGAFALTQEGLLLVRRAVPHLEAACKDREAPADSFYNLGRCLYAIEEYERALEVFRRGLRLEDSEEMNVLAALAAAKQARDWLEIARTQSLMADHKKETMKLRARQFMDAAVQYFRQALRKDELNPTLHANIGLAYMLRNQEHDVEAALRHWQRMRAVAGDAAASRYAEFDQIQSAEHATRVQFDDSEVACRHARAFDWISTSAPVPVGLHYVLEPVAEHREWRLIAHADRLIEALQVRDQIADATQALARIEA